MTEKKLTMVVEDEPVRRYQIGYDAFHESYDTATEAVAAYEKYDRVVRPVIEGSKPRSEYSIRDRDRQMTIRELRQAAAKEKKEKPPEGAA